MNSIYEDLSGKAVYLLMAIAMKEHVDSRLATIASVLSASSTVYSASKEYRNSEST
jgi:hypothetical protein